MFEISSILFGILIFAILILIIREIVMWYWKINTIVYTLEEQNEILLDIVQELRKK